MSIIIFYCYTHDSSQDAWVGHMWEIVGLALLSGKQLIAQALEDDSFLFLNVLLDNIAKVMEK